MGFKSRLTSSVAALIAWFAVATFLSHRRFATDRRDGGAAFDDAPAERSSSSRNDEHRYVPDVVVDGWPECRRRSSDVGSRGGRCRWDLCVEALRSCETSSLEGDDEEKYASLRREWMRLARDLDVTTVSSCGILAANLVGNATTSLEILYGFEAMIPLADRERIEGHAESYNRREGNRYLLVVGEDDERRVGDDPKSPPPPRPLRLALTADANVSIDVLSMRDGLPRECDDGGGGGDCASVTTTEFWNDFGERVSVPTDWIFPTKNCSIDGVPMQCPSRGTLVLAAMAAPTATTLEASSTTSEQRRDHDGDDDDAPSSHLDVHRQCWTAGAPPPDRPLIDVYPCRPRPVDPYHLVPPDVRSNWTDDCDGQCEAPSFAKCFPARERNGLDRDLRLLLRELMRVSDETNVTAVPNFGSLIASLYRNATLMRWDSDLDFLIWAADTAKLERFAPFYNARQDRFRLFVQPDWRHRYEEDPPKGKRKYYKEKGVHFVYPNARLVRRSGTHLELYAMYLDGQGAEASSPPASSSRDDVVRSTMQTSEDDEGDYVSTPWDWMFPLQECYLEGVRLNCPARGSAMLNAWYDADVREPDHRLDLDTGCWFYAPPPKPSRLWPKRR